MGRYESWQGNAEMRRSGFKVDAAKTPQLKRSSMRRNGRSGLTRYGKKAKLRESINRPNRARFRALGLLDVCEANLEGCWPNGRKTWAHGKKDRNLTIDERKNLVIRACTVCHHKLDEQMSADEMLTFVQDAIERRGTRG